MERNKHVLTEQAVDGSLCSLHCGVSWDLSNPAGVSAHSHQEPFRRRDLAKTVSAKLIRDKTSAYGGDKFAAADVAPDNTSSQAMCKSLNGKVHWAGSW